VNEEKIFRDDGYLLSRFFFFPLNLHPNLLHLVQRCILELAALGGQPGFDFAEASVEFTVGAA